MKQPSIEYIRECFSYDPETGVVLWNARPIHHFPSEHAMRVFNSRQAGKKAGGLNGHGYITIRLRGSNLKAHRVAWVLQMGEWPASPIDHRNGVRHDNRFANLRLATISQNNINSRTRSDNTSGARGIEVAPNGTWRARITVGGKRHHLGYFVTQDEAISAYEAAANDLHGEYARAS